MLRELNSQYLLLKKPVVFFYEIQMAHGQTEDDPDWRTEFC